MKFLYFGDMHERANAPSSRTDDYQCTLDKKVAEIKEIAKRHQVSSFLHPGDFLDSPKISDDFLMKVMKRWSSVDVQDLAVKVANGQLNATQLYERFSQNIPMVGAIGNHELFGGSMRAFDKTSIAFLIKIGFMSHPTIDQPLIFTSEEGFTVAITCADYTLDIDKTTDHAAYIVKQKAADFHIHIVHGYGTVLDFKDLIPHTKIDDFKKETKADLTIIGHDHIGFDPVVYDKKIFVNPGAPVRLSCDEKEMARQPKVMLIEITKEKGIQLKMIPLASIQPASEVFDLTLKDQKKATEKNLKKIQTLVQEATEKTQTDDKIDEKLIRKIVMDIAKETKATDDVLNPMLKKLDEKIAANPHTLSVAKPYKIKSLTLENFQSHKHSHYDFSDHLNVFVGPSGSGKTSVFRAFRWIYEDGGSASKRYIRYGEKYASAKIELDDGTIIERRVEKKSNGFNGYIVTDQQGTETKMNTKGIKTIQEMLGYRSLDLDGKKSVEMNFMQQSSPWFFIGSETTGSDRAKIIGNIYGTEYADACIKEYEADCKKQALILKEKNDELHEVNEKILVFPDLSIPEKIISQIQALFDKIDINEKLLDELILAQQQLDTLQNKMTVLNKLIHGPLENANQADTLLKHCIDLNATTTELLHEVKALEKTRLRGIVANQIAETLKLCPLIQNKLNQALLNQNKLVDLNQHEKTIHSIILRGTCCKKILTDLKESPHAAELLLNTAKWQNDLDELNRSQTLLQTICDKIKTTKTIAEKMQQIDEVSTKLQTIKDMQQTLNDASHIYQSLTQYASIIESCKKQVKEQNEKIIKLKNEYVTEFDKVKVCPLCRQEINHDIVLKIGKEVLNNPMGQ